MPPLLAITGGIGAGKSTALDAFGRLGAATLSSDEVVAEIYRDPSVVAAVRERFGEPVLTPGGEVDRPALGSRAFGDRSAIGFLESLVHPRVSTARRRWLSAERARVPPAPLLVCEVPLLFEVGAETDFDAVLVVTAPESVRRSRVAARGQDFAGRSSRQMAESEKTARATEVFVNDGNESDLERWAGEVFGKYAVGPDP